MVHSDKIWLKWESAFFFFFNQVVKTQKKNSGGDLPSNNRAIMLSIFNLSVSAIPRCCSYNKEDRFCGMAVTIRPMFTDFCSTEN